MIISLHSGSKQIELGTWDFGELKDNENLKGKELTVVLPDWPAGQVKLVLEVDGKPEWRSEHVILLK